ADGALLAVRLAHRGEEVIGAADLERAGALQAFRLDEQPAAELRIDALVLEQRRADRDALEAAGGGLDIGKGRQRRHQATPRRAGREDRSVTCAASLPGRLSSGALARLTQTTLKPNCAAPCASQQFDDRKQTLSGFTPQRA